ncbi:MAG: hypothetical protein ABIZ49_13370 [Opitutaceae bacterium]
MENVPAEILVATQEAERALRLDAVASWPIIAAASDGSSIATVTWGLFFGAALVNLAIALLCAPEGYEDETGFHLADGRATSAGRRVTDSSKRARFFPGKRNGRTASRFGLFKRFPA